MVSPLSLRLMGMKSDNSNGGSRTSSSITSRSVSLKPSESLMSERPIGSDIGTSETESVSESSNLPIYIDLLAKNRKGEHHNSYDERSKRRKTDEMNYLAATAKDDMARGGLRVPVVRTKNPRALPCLSGIDISKVQLIESATVKSSPFLATQVGATPIVSSLKHDVEQFSLVQLINMTSSFYKSENVSAKQTSTVSDENESNISSVTESDSEDNIEEEDSKKRGGLPISMADALSICKQARIVLLSSDPFTVVHVNAAYMRMTGLDSLKILGHTFSEILQDEDALQECQSLKGGLSSLSGVHGHLVRTKSNLLGGLKCRVFVSPVGINANSVTHYAVNFEPVDSGTDDIGSNAYHGLIRSDEPVAASYRSMNVMG